MPRVGPSSPKTPKIHVTHPNQPFGSHDSLIPNQKEEKLKKEGVDNPVFSFDNVSLISRSDAPSRSSDPGEERNSTLPPIRRGSYSPYLGSSDKDSLAVPGSSPARHPLRRGSALSLDEDEDLANYGVRRSSLASTWSRDSGLSHRRLKPITSLSINDMACEAKVQPLPSPGLLSTHSMWSTSDLFNRPSSRQQDLDNVSSLTNSNSLSNVSSTLSERMHELVRAFSSRTQRTKEKTCQPPSPSSVSSLDARSAVSGQDDGDEPPPRNFRLGSFIPTGSRTSVVSETSETNKEMLVGVWQCRFRMPKCLRKIRFPNTIEPQSKLYVGWLFIVMLAYMYNAWVIPLRGFFPYQTAENIWYWFICDYTCDFIYILDIILFKSRLRFVNEGIIECDRKLTQKNYMKKQKFKFDVFSLLPLDLLYLVPEIGFNPWLRIPRLFKVQTFWEFYERCDQAANASAHAIRIIKTMTYMLFLIHIETCGYYAVSVYEGFKANRWVYNGTGNAYIRCFYLATKTATSIGNNPKPTNQLEYLFMTLYWLSGVFVFALLIGQIRDIVEAAGHVKAAYRKQIDSTIRYMESINIPKEMQERVRIWFLYNWEQTKTINEGQLLQTLPKKMQADLAINVHFNTLSKVQLFSDCDKNLLYDLVLKLKPSLFLPKDYICYKGEVGKEMYIVSEGQVEVVGGEDGETVLATLHEGSVFGEISLLAMSGGNRRTANVRSKGFTNVFTLSKADFEEAMREYPEAQKLLKKRAKKLLKENARLEKKSQKVEAEEIIKTPTETPKFVKTVIKVMDPESNIVRQLDPSIKSSMRSVISTKPSSRSSSGRSNKSNKSNRSNRSGGNKGGGSSPAVPCDKQPAPEEQATFVFGSEISLNDIPDDNNNDADSLSDGLEDQILVVERVETSLPNVPMEELEQVMAGMDKRKQVLKDDLDRTNNSLESQDSGIPSMKRSASQSTEKSLSNQDSKDSFNTTDLMDVISEEKKGEGHPNSDHHLPKRASSSLMFDHEREEIELTSSPVRRRSSEIIDGTRRKTSAESREGGSRKTSSESREASSIEDGTRRKISSESRDGTRRKTSTESRDGTRRKVSGGSRDGKYRKDDGARRKVSGEHSHRVTSPELNGAQSPSVGLPLRGDNSVLMEEKHEIPLENKVTCAVEIHREKTRTPSSIFSLEHQERPGSNSFYRQNSKVSYETEL